MPQENTTKQLFINQLTKEQYKELLNTSQLSSSELYVITDDNHYTEDEITALLSYKQDKLVVGENVNITEDGIISVNLSKFYTKEELNSILADKADLMSAGHSLEYSDNILTLRNINGTILSYVTIKSILQTDDITVSYNDNNELQSIGEITKKGTPKYTWIGTQEEYDEDFKNGIIDDNTECLITDSEAESVTPIVQFDAPTKLSDLANDINFVTNDVLQDVKSELEEKIGEPIDNNNLVHKTGTEIINGFKKFTEEITIENGETTGRIVHKNTTSNTPSITDGYIEFGENTLKYGKESEKGLLYHTSNDIFHSGNLLAGENIAIIKQGQNYTINGQAGGGTGGTTVYTDEETITKNDQEVITTIGVKSKNNTVLYDWIGTLEEYNQGVSDGTIKSNWICWITDDERQNAFTPTYGSDVALLDIIITNQALEGVDKIGKELQGSLILKSEYPDAYKKLLNWKNKSENNKITENISGIEVTYLQCSNGWKIIDISNKNIYDQLFETTGSANYFVLDETSENFYLPKTNNILQPNVNINELGRYNEAGLPNIEGTIGFSGSSGVGNTGVFQTSKINSNIVGYVIEANNHWTTTFDASRSSSIYGNSTTVQPQSTNVFIYYKVGNTLQESATIDMEAQILNLQEDFEKKSLINNITNCITEIPQNIKIDLADGVLTLKAGSIVTIPNGLEEDGVTPKFDYVNIESDLTISILWAVSGLSAVFYDVDNKALYNQAINYANCNVWSGATPTIDKQYGMWYDTSSNIIQKTSDNGATWINKYSLPICIASTDANKTPVSIDQVFNGIGYIGSAIWVDKGVKALIPNGRNEDGSLKNIEVETTNVFVNEGLHDWGVITTLNILLFDNGSIGSQSVRRFTEDKIVNTNDIRTYSYHTKENRWYYSPDSGATWLLTNFAIIGSITENAYNKTFTIFKPKTAFRALDYSDKSYIGNWSLPSNEHIDLAYGGHGTTYTAPANGFFTLIGYGVENDIYLKNTTTGLINAIEGNVPSNSSTGIFLPCKKGDVVQVGYYNGTVSQFRFIYAESEV